MYTLFEYLRDEKICLSYLGSFDDSITDKLTGISEYYMENSNRLGKLKNKVSFLIAESFQNVVRHGNEHKFVKGQIKNHRDFFQINAFDDRVVLSSSNLIAHAHTTDLEKSIKRVNSLSEDELKQLYNDVLENQGFSDKGGAGLGLIEMARKSGLPLKYYFNFLEADHWQFFLGLEIINKNEENVSKIDILSIVDFYKRLIEKNTVILYKGDISKDVILPLIEILHNNFMADGVMSAEEKKSIVTLIEAIQNVSKHGKIIDGIRPGIFVIGEVNNSFVVECGNFLEQKDIEPLRNFLGTIKKLDPEKLISLYKKRVTSSGGSLDANNGLGLLQIATNCSNNFSYEFTEAPNNETFFSIKITV